MPLVEKRYAEALVDISAEGGMIDTYQDQLKLMVDLLMESSDLRYFLLSPQIANGIKKDMIVKIFDNEPVTMLGNFLKFLVDKGRLKLLPEIYKEFSRLADIKRNILTMEIISASTLSEIQIERIKEKYKNEYKALSVIADIKIDKDLVGGVKVKIGDRVIDGSIKGRLEALRQLTIG